MSATNPAYAHLAYKLALFEHVTNYLLENCVGTDDHPPLLVNCPHISQQESVVPRDEIIHFIDQLRVNSSRVEDEMNKFEFVRRNDAGFYDSELDSVLKPGRRETKQKPASAPSGEVVVPEGKGSNRRGGRKTRRAP